MVAEQRPARVELLTTSEDAGARLDVYLGRELQLSRADVRHLIDDGRVWVQGSNTWHRLNKKGSPIAPGMTLRVDLSLLPGAARDDSISLDILYEDADAVVVNKPAGVPSAADRSRPKGNMAAALLARYPEMADVGFSRFDPGLLHRLDNQTSGVLLAARNAATFEYLRRHWGERVIKRYLAVVSTLDSTDPCVPGVVFDICSDLQSDPRDGSRVQMLAGRRFQTHALVLAVTGHRALLDVTVGFAYRHQIRVHLSQLGLALVGDNTYGHRDLEGAPRHGLHAYHIACAGTVAFSVVAPLPDEFTSLLRGPLASAAEARLETVRSTNATT